MTRPSFIALAFLGPVLVCIAMLAGSCGGSSSDDPSPTDNGASEVTAQIEDFFTQGEATSGTIEAGGEFELPDGGTVTLPQNSESDVEISVAPADLTDEATSAFEDFHPDEQMEDAVYKITMAFSGSDPGYVIITRPATHENSRIFATGYVDSTTGVPDWAPVPSTFDDEAGEVTAGVGLGVFQRGPAPQARKLGAPPLAQEGQTYVGYVGVSVAGQLFKSEIEFVLEEPTDDQVVAPFDGPPIDVRGQVGARFVHITHEPLANMEVTSDFGPRPTPRGGGSSQHAGVDYRATTGTTVFAVGDGTVSSARCQLSSVNCGRTRGNTVTGGFIVVIDHGDGETSHYMHMTNPSTVSAEGAVTSGQSIGLSDATGGVAQHLHFELHKNGAPVDAEILFNGQVNVTVAMAIDMNLQEDTRQEISVKVTRGLEPADMEDYASSVAVTGVEPGFHELQFVAIKSNGSLEVLGSVPLRIEGAGLSGVTGSYISYRDITTDLGGGYVETDKQITQATFSLVAVGENRLEGQGHVSWVLAYGYAAPTDCPFASIIGSVEWDVFYEGEFDVDPYGGIDVNFDGTPDHSPDYVETFTFTGCEEQNSTQTEYHDTPSIGSFTLVDGEYYLRVDEELDENQTGEDYYEVVVDATND